MNHFLWAHEVNRREQIERELDTVREHLVQLKQKYDELLAQYQTLIHDYEELRDAVRSRHRDDV